MSSMCPTCSLGDTSSGERSETGEIKAHSSGLFQYRDVVRIISCVVALCFSTVQIQALDPRFPPGHNFDLSHWYLTLPDANASTISPVLLTAGFTNAHFETGLDGAMVFMCPVTGGTTIGSDFPRCELRELLDPGDNAINWSGYGRHVMSAQCKVTQLPSSRRVVIGQIHSYLGDAPPLVKLSYNNGAVEGLVRLDAASSTDLRIPLANVGLSNAINYQLILRDGMLTMTVNGVSKSTNVFLTDLAWKQQTFYFKAGNYCQDNSGPTNEAASVEFYELGIQHSPPTVITDVTTRTNSLCLTWSSLAGSWYYIQGTTNVGSTNWLAASPNVQAAIDSTSYCIALPSPYRFFRVAITSP